MMVVTFGGALVGEKIYFIFIFGVIFLSLFFHSLLFISDSLSLSGSQHKNSKHTGNVYEICSHAMKYAMKL